jgi:hypothetical protein
MFAIVAASSKVHCMRLLLQQLATFLVCSCCSCCCCCFVSVLQGFQDRQAYLPLDSQARGEGMSVTASCMHCNAAVRCFACMCGGGSCISICFMGG